MDVSFKIVTCNDYLFLAKASVLGRFYETYRQLIFYM